VIGKAVESAMGHPASSSQARREFAMPRKDLHVTLGGVTIKPPRSAPGPPSREHGRSHGHGRPRATEDEVQPVMSKLQGGIQEAAIPQSPDGESPTSCTCTRQSCDAVQMAGHPRGTRFD
jgi:hypothetical protein